MGLVVWCMGSLTYPLGVALSIFLNFVHFLVCSVKIRGDVSRSGTQALSLTSVEPLSGCERLVCGGERSAK